MNLRDLRLWHWRQAMHHRNAQKLARAYDASYVERDMHGQRADFHIKCVQTLNVAAECDGTTAEHDNEIEYRSYQ